MTLKEFFSSGADSQDHINFKIKPFNSIFEVKEPQKEKEDKSYPPPVFPKWENRDGM